MESKLVETLIIEEPILPDFMTDEDLGKEVRALANYLWGKSIPGFKDVRIMASLYNLVRAVETSNAGTLTMELSGWYDVNSPQDKKDFVVKVGEKSEMNG